MTKLHTETFGQGHPIVLLHGWAMHSRLWRDFALQLAEHYQVTCIDLPGHGQSEAMTPFTLETVSEAVAEAVKHKSCVWLGWSLGANIVLDIARRYPARVDGVVLLAGSPKFCSTAEDSWCGMEESVLNSFAANLQDNCQATLLRFLALQIESKDRLKSLKAAVLSCPPPDSATLQGGLDILKTADLRSALANLDKPAAAVLGRLDRLVPVAVAPQMQALQPRLTLTVLDKAAHVPFLSHPAEVIVVIDRFMDTLGGAQALPVNADLEKQVKSMLPHSSKK